MKDLGTAFIFPFKDKNWVSKFLLAALFMILALIGIGIFILAGYLVQVTQRSMRNDPNPLPPWNDIGVKFVLGFKYVLIYVVYILPILFLAIPLFALAIAAQFASQGEILALVVSIYAFGFTILIIPYSIALNLLLPVITYRFALHERMGDALDVTAVVKTFTRSWQNTIVIALICVGVQSFAAVGLILFLIGVLFTIFYSYLVSAYLAGALYREHYPEAQPVQAALPAW
jgi:hypothetical protein